VHPPASDAKAVLAAQERLRNLGADHAVEVEQGAVAISPLYPERPTLGCSRRTRSGEQRSGLGVRGLAVEGLVEAFLVVFTDRTGVIRLIAFNITNVNAKA